MKIDFIPKFVMLLAGAIVCVVMIAKDMDPLYSLIFLLITLIVFYIIGRIARFVVKKVIEGNRFTKEEEDNTQSVPFPNPNFSQTQGGNEEKKEDSSVPAGEMKKEEQAI